MVPIWEQEQLDKVWRRQEEYEAQVQDYNMAIANFTQAFEEVEAWIHSQRES